MELVTNFSVNVMSGFQKLIFTISIDNFVVLCYFAIEGITYLRFSGFQDIYEENPHIIPILSVRPLLDIGH